MLRRVVCCALLAAASADIVNLTITPTSYVNVESNSVLTFTLSGVVTTEFAYSVTFTDTNAIYPTDYQLYWLRWDPPSPYLPKPPDPSQLDLSLLYVLGDSRKNRTEQVTCWVYRSGGSAGVCDVLLSSVQRQPAWT